MSKAVLASLKHYCSTVENPQHEDCPPWRSYQRDLATGSVTYKQVKSPLAPCIQNIVQPIFEKLGSESFLQGCKNVVTSNVNESFHHLLWNLAPKERLKDWLNKKQGNYVTHEIQNEILTIMSKAVLRSLLKTIKGNMYSIICDEDTEYTVSVVLPRS